MSLFDSLVDEALKARAELAPLRSVVEKELLHHDILREMSAAGLLSGLTYSVEVLQTMDTAEGAAPSLLRTRRLLEE